MSKSEILAELPKLSAEERRELQLRLAELNGSEQTAGGADHTSVEAHTRRAKLIGALARGYSVQSEESFFELKKRSPIGIRSWG